MNPSRQHFRRISHVPIEEIKEERRRIPKWTKKKEIFDLERLDFDNEKKDDEVID